MDLFLIYLAIGKLPVVGLSVKAVGVLSSKVTAKYRQDSSCDVVYATVSAHDPCKLDADKVDYRVALA